MSEAEAPPPAHRVGVVSVNNRTPDLVLGALASLEGELDPARDRAVVVDNASGDGSPERIRGALASRGWEGWAQLVEAGGNLGFSAGNNRGIEAAPAAFHLLLNSDAYLRPGALARLLEEAAAHPEAGLLSPRLEWPDGRPQVSCFRDPTPTSELIDAAATGPVTRWLARRDVPLPVSDVAMEPEWTSFACVLLRAEAWRAVGPMDPGYFLFYEDVDYCRRAREAGFRIRHVPAARAVHLRGGSASVKSAQARRERLPAYYWQARARYFAKFGGPAGRLRANLGWLAGRGISLARELVGHKRPHLPERSWLDIWRAPAGRAGRQGA